MAGCFPEFAQSRQVRCIVPSLRCMADWYRCASAGWPRRGHADTARQVMTPEPVGEVGGFLARPSRAADGGAVGLGVDLPIGVPRAYAARQGGGRISAFLRRPRFGRISSRSARPCRRSGRIGRFIRRGVCEVDASGAHAVHCGLGRPAGPVAASATAPPRSRSARRAAFLDARRQPVRKAANRGVARHAAWPRAARRRTRPAVAFEGAFPWTCWRRHDRRAETYPPRRCVTRHPSEGKQTPPGDRAGGGERLLARWRPWQAQPNAALIAAAHDGSAAMPPARIVSTACWACCVCSTCSRAIGRTLPGRSVDPAMGGLGAGGRRAADGLANLLPIRRVAAYRLRAAAIPEIRSGTHPRSVRVWRTRSIILPCGGGCELCRPRAAFDAAAECYQRAIMVPPPAAPAWLMFWAAAASTSRACRGADLIQPRWGSTRRSPAAIPRWALALSNLDRLTKRWTAFTRAVALRGDDLQALDQPGHPAQR